MAGALPDKCSVVVVGGGIIGCSVLYHLAKLGIRDAVLLERHQISSGTTWHSAALVTPLRPSAAGTELAKYGAALYSSLEAETGQATGWRQCGHLNIAASQDRLDALKHAVSNAQGMGIDLEIIGASDIKGKWPLLKTDDLLGAIWMPVSGRVNPTDVCYALLKGARARGAAFFENTPVTKFDVSGGKVRGVETPSGRIECEIIVNCTGLWGRATSAAAGVAAPLFACEHFYMLTEPMDGVTPMLPVVRDGDAYLYVREEVGGLLVGCFEPNARPLPLNKIPESSSFFLMNEDWDHFGPMMEKAMVRIPDLEHARVRQLINGPESFTLDHNPILGESPEVKNFFLACGMNSSGVGMAGGIGWAMADWIVKRRPPVDLWESDVRRYVPFQNNNLALEERIPEVLSGHFSVPWPGKDYKTARGIRRSPIHNHLLERGAYFSQRGSWERAVWYKRQGSLIPPAETFGRPSYFSEWRDEHTSARQNVALFDQSAFAKLLVQGRDVEAYLQRVCAGDMSVAEGRIVYTPLLNELGGIESDMTITRLDETTYLAITGAMQARRDADWLRRNIKEDEFVTVTDVTASYATFVVTGPRSRDLLSRLTTAKMDNASFPFGSAQKIEIGYAEALALRVSYAGELGWELYVSTDFAQSVFEFIMTREEDFAPKLAGSVALNSLRIEKSFRSWGHDIGPRDLVFESGMMFAVSTKKPVEFIGRDATMRSRDAGYGRRLVGFAFDNAEGFPHGHEPIYRNGKFAGNLTSASYGHTLDRAVGLGWLAGGGLQADDILSDRFEIEVAGDRFAVSPSLKPLHDPSGTSMRS